MSVRRLPYRNLGSLLQAEVPKRRNEDEKDRKLFEELSHSYRRGYLTKPELVEICMWKSPRAIRRIKSNSEDMVRRATGEAFTTKFEKRKMEALMELRGVGIPMASSILTLTNPKDYGVIDIRVWSLLYKLGAVNSNRKGANFTFKQWYRYLSILRYFARKFGVKAREIELTLFRYHQSQQIGNLYT